MSLDILQYLLYRNFDQHYRQHRQIIQIIGLLLGSTRSLFIRDGAGLQRREHEGETLRVFGCSESMPSDVKHACVPLSLCVCVC